MVYSFSEKQTNSGCTQIAQTNDCDGLNFFSGYQHNIWTVCRSVSWIVVPKHRSEWESFVSRESELTFEMCCSSTETHVNGWILRQKKTKPVPQLCSFAHIVFRSHSQRKVVFIHSNKTESHAHVLLWWETVNVQREYIVIGLFCTSSIRMTTERVREYDKHVKNVQNNREEHTRVRWPRA